MPPDQTSSAKPGLAAFAVAFALMTAACTGGAIPTTASSVANSRPSITSTAAADPSSSATSIPASSQPSAQAEPTPIPIGTGPQDRMPGAPSQCDTPGRPCQFTAGTYQTFGRWAFLPGLTMSIPDGWNSTEQDAGEFNLNSPDFPDSGLLFWRDVIPVEPDGTHVTTIPSTVAGITDWLRADPQLVVTKPREVAIGKGLDTTSFVIDVAKGAVNKDPECAAMPAKQTCFPILTDPAHWGEGAFTVVSTDNPSFYLATIGPVTNRHLLVVAILGDSARFEKAVAPILDSLDASRVTFN